MARVNQSFRCHASGTFQVQERVADQPPHLADDRRVTGWVTSSSFVRRVSLPSGCEKSSARQQTGCGTVGGKPNAICKLRATRRPTASSISIGSTTETSDEIACRKAFHRHRGSQDQRKSRRRVLEG